MDILLKYSARVDLKCLENEHDIILTWGAMSKQSQCEWKKSSVLSSEAMQWTTACICNLGQKHQCYKPFQSHVLDETIEVKLVPALKWNFNEVWAKNGCPVSVSIKPTWWLDKTLDSVVCLSVCVFVCMYLYACMHIMDGTMFYELVAGNNPGYNFADRQTDRHK
jgi:hypothetical protein